MAILSVPASSPYLTFRMSNLQLSGLPEHTVKVLAGSEESLLVALVYFPDTAQYGVVQYGPQAESPYSVFPYFQAAWDEFYRVLRDNLSFAELA